MENPKDPIGNREAWGSIVVGALCCWSKGLGIDPRWCRWVFFPKLPMEPCALGSTQLLKMSTRELLGYLTTFTVPKVEKIWSLNLPDPQGPSQACIGKTLPLPIGNRTRDLPTCSALPQPIAVPRTSM